MRSQTILHALAACTVIACLPSAGFADSSVRWRNNLDAAKIEAIQSNRLLLLHFTTKSCGPCKALDQNVFSQPQVGPAIEENFVPVRIDADSSPALASAFRIDRVPSEIVLTPQGNVLANPPIPDKPDAYLAQLQNLSRHYRQTTSPAAGGGQQAPVNSAYANLPVSPPAATPAQSANQAAPVAVATNVTLPQTQANPFAAPPEAQTVADARMGGASYADPSSAAAMPASAMPRNYRQPAAEGVLPGAGIAAAAPATAETAAPQSQAAPAAAAAVASVAAANAPAKSVATQLLAGAPPVAFDGCCPVTLKTLKRWTVGDPALGVVHRGRTYLFASENERQQFWADPDAYSPVFAGLDPVLLLDHRQSIDGSRRYGYEYGGLFYLFSSEETKQKFAANPNAYAAGVRQAMSRIDSPQDGAVRR